MHASWLTFKISMLIMIKKSTIILKLDNILHMWWMWMGMWTCLCWLIHQYD
jgi:hypothetical protein